MASGTINGDRLRPFIDRIERLEEEKQGLADDIREIINEAYVAGFDRKTIRRVVKLRKMTPEERAAQDHLTDQYMQALEAKSGTSPKRAKNSKSSGLESLQTSSTGPSSLGGPVESGEGVAGPAPQSEASAVGRPAGVSPEQDTDAGNSAGRDGPSRDAELPSVPASGGGHIAETAASPSETQNTAESPSSLGSGGVAEVTPKSPPHSGSECATSLTGDDSDPLTIPDFLRRTPENPTPWRGTSA